MYGCRCVGRFCKAYFMLCYVKKEFKQKFKEKFRTKNVTFQEVTISDTWDVNNVRILGVSLMCFGVYFT